MGVKATWGPKTFLTSTSKIVPLNDFTTSVTLKADSENDTSGTEPTNTRGRDLQPASLTTIYHAAAGVDPMSEFNSWVALLGESYPLYVGGRRVGPAEKFMLKSVDASDVQQIETGAVIQLKVGLTFIEHSEGKSSKLANVSGSSSSASQAKATYDATVAAKKEEAMQATPSKSTKATKATTTTAATKKTAGGGGTRVALTR